MSSRLWHVQKFSWRCIQAARDKEICSTCERGRRDLFVENESVPGERVPAVKTWSRSNCISCCQADNAICYLRQLLVDIYQTFPAYLTCNRHAQSVVRDRPFNHGPIFDLTLRSIGNVDVIFRKFTIIDLLGQ